MVAMTPPQNGAGPDGSLGTVSELSREPARLRLEVSPDEVDIVSGELWALGTIGIEEQLLDGVVVLYAGFDSAEAADEAAGRLGRFSVLEELGGGDFLDVWREHATPHRAGHRIVVKQPWVDHDVQAVELVLHIEPGHSFGSGSHPSTRLALAHLERLLEGNEAVLDVGCGTGVLSVAAARLGAVDVLGIDIDPDAARLALDNAHRNGVSESVRATVTPLAEVTGAFQVVIANITADVLRDLGPHLTPRVAPGGRLVLSGIFDHQVDGVVAACAPLQVLRQSEMPRNEGTWVALDLG